MALHRHPFTPAFLIIPRSPKDVKRRFRPSGRPAVRLAAPGAYGHARFGYLVEFQSTDDPLMALRIHTYTGLLYQELARNGQLDADGRLPAVLPLVLYNGDEPWVSPLQMGGAIAGAISAEQGIEQGIEQGLDRERALLCRMTASRFGAATAERLAELLAPITNAERLADIGDWLVQCDTGADFLARVGAAVGYNTQEGSRLTAVVLDRGYHSNDASLG